MNLVKNGDFAALDAKGKPKDWAISFSGPPEALGGSFSLVAGPEDRKAIRIECATYPPSKKTKWIILSQSGILKTRKGKRLLVSLWVKQEKLQSAAVSLAIMNRRPWSKIAQTTIPVTEEWQKVETILPIGRASDNTRFQIFFTEVGTLYVSDIRVAETDRHEIEFNPIRKRMLEEMQPAPQKNIIRNSSFEVGIDGWGTADFDHNVVKIDSTQARYGRNSARMDFDEQSLPVGYRDYHRSKRPARTRLRLVSAGWLRLEKGKTYSLSAFLKSNKTDQKAILGVFYMTRKSDAKSIQVKNEWERYELTFAARDAFAFVGVQSETEDHSERLWVDAVQLEKGAVTEYSPRYPVEIAVYPKRPGGVYYADEAVAFDVAAHFHGGADRAAMDVRVVNYRDECVHESRLDVSKGGGATDLPVPIKDNGYYRLTGTITGQEADHTFRIPFVVLFPYAKTYGGQSSRFGTNHPYYSDLCQALSREAGIGWVRDWTLTWNSVEPEKGQWDFSHADVFYDRARKFGLNILAILPDPSSSWASSGPDDIKGKRLGDAYADLWYLPKDMSDYRTYCAKCMERYSDRARVWEVMNEPYKTQGWKVDDTYSEFLRIVRDEARKAGQGLEVMRCGLVYFRDEKASALASELSDILSEHVYPRYNNTKRFLEAVRSRDRFLKEHNIHKDIWMTEYGKYSDDNPHVQDAGFSHFLSNGEERVATAYNIKYLTILFSHGVSKVFFHQRTWPLGLNWKPLSIHFDMLFRYGPTPHKLFAAANAFSWLLPPGTSPGVPVNEEGPVFAYRFERKTDRVLILWADKEEVKPAEDVMKQMQGAAIYNMMGGRVEKLRAVGDEPVYVIGDAGQMDVLEKLLR